MKRVKLVVVMFALAAGMPALSGHGLEPKQEPKKIDKATGKELSDLMRRKLENSQKVLEGVAMNDFDKISKHADELISISKQAEWKVLKTPEYEVYSNQFRRNAAEQQLAVVGQLQLHALDRLSDRPDPDRTGRVGRPDGGAL